MKKPVIVPVPEKMKKFFKGKETMLHPDIEMVADLVEQIPPGKITTIGALAEKMALDHGTDVSCPLRTGNAVKKIAETAEKNDPADVLPFWRVIRNNHELISSKAADFVMAKLEDEGFRLVRSKQGKIKVTVEKQNLFTY